MVAILYNNSGLFGDVMTGMIGMTGSLFLSLLLLVILLVAFCLMFRMPIEVTSIFVVPVLLVMMAFEGAMIPVGGVFLIYLAILFAKNLPTTD